MDIRCVKDIGGLVAYLSENLNWPAAVENVEDIADYMYDFTADDLGIRPEEFAKVESLKQLPPLVEDQPWGIFAVEFASAKFSVTALRRILSRLVPKKRNAADHAVWDCKDLLFFCFWGKGRNRRIMVAHFEETEDKHFLVRAFDFEPAVEDPMVLKHFTERLLCLQWPNTANDAQDHKMWHDSWLCAFDTYYRETITTSAKLAVELARVAKDVKERILATLEAETERGFVHKLCDKVRKTLVHNLSTSEFADMYAQTIVYGLFSARCMDETPETFSAEEAISLIPTTNPFLKSLMRDCFQRRGRLSFDELGIGDIVDLLSHVDAKVIADDFGRQSGGGREDPVIHFYEEFLKEYDKAQKVERGVFYTPQPVVTFTVRAVDYLLKTVFGLADGLACDEKIIVEKEFKVYNKTKKGNLGKGFRIEKREVEMPRIQLLDPATGTGTYIRQTILQIFENFKKRWENGRARTPNASQQFREDWSRYVDAHVLPRLYAFELMMAPYAVAHMKLAMVLKDTGYDFKGGERLKVYLTNTLEEPGDTAKQMTLDFGESDPLATESLAAKEAKKNGGINIVIGNPPYSGVSMNNGKECAWIDELVDEYKFVQGISVNEQKLRIRNDYIKFIRYGQAKIAATGAGILAYINPNAYFDGPTLRGMRWNLLNEYDEIYILNLHGDAKKKEKTPNGGKDENVFAIKEGVAINIFIKRPKNGSQKKNLATVYYCDLLGAQDKKYEFLQNKSLFDLKWIEFTPAEPFFEFSPREHSNVDDYQNGFSLTEFLPVGSTGVQTSRDSMVVSANRDELVSRFRKFAEEIVPLEDFRSMYLGEGASAGDSNFWNLKSARQSLKSLDHEAVVQGYAYRPFDQRYVYYSSSVVHRLREKVFGNFSNENIGLIVCRQGQAVGDMEWNVVFVTKKISDLNMFYRGGGCTFPLYLYDTEVEPPSRRVNFDAAIYKKICKAAGLKFSDQDLQATACKHESSACKSCPENSNPQLVFDYIYGVLHSGKYRKKYAEFLKIDFPRIPYPKNGAEFRTMAAFGAELRRIHCMEDFDEAAEVKLVGGGDGRPSQSCKSGKDSASPLGGVPVQVVKPVWKDGCVYVDKEVKFTNVAEDLWNFYIGGYQPLQKWLKDRKGRELSAEDVSHYKRMVRAIASTRDIMAKIDAAYEV